MKYAAAYGVALVIFLALDALWLGVIAKNLYFTRMADLLLEQPKWAVAVIFYAVYVVGLTYFAISGGLTEGWRSAALNGALFGFFCYLTYDATNLAVLKGYDPLVAIVDTIWGAVLSGVTSAATVAILTALRWND
jgi:uncharacterized membrane protein